MRDPGPAFLFSHPFGSSIFSYAQFRGGSVSFSSNELKITEVAQTTPLLATENECQRDEGVHLVSDLKKDPESHLCHAILFCLLKVGNKAGVNYQAVILRPFLVFAFCSSDAKETPGCPHFYGRTQESGTGSTNRTCCCLPFSTVSIALRDHHHPTPEGGPRERQRPSSTFSCY